MTEKKAKKLALKIGKILNGYIALHMKQKEKQLNDEQINDKLMGLFQLVLKMQRAKGGSYKVCAHKVGRMFCNMEAT